MALRLPLHLAAFILALGLVVFAVYHGWRTPPGADDEITVIGARAERVIDAAAVRRQGANGAVIGLEKAAPRALIKGRGLLGADCRVSALDGRPPAGVVVFELEGGGPGLPRPSTCRRINKILPLLDERVGSVTVLSNGDYRLYIGRAQYVIAEASRSTLDKMWRAHDRLQRQTEQPFALDLRYTSGSALRAAAGR